MNEYFDDPVKAYTRLAPDYVHLCAQFGEQSKSRRVHLSSYYRLELIN